MNSYTDTKRRLPGCRSHGLSTCSKSCVDSLGCDRKFEQLTTGSVSDRICDRGCRRVICQLPDSLCLIRPGTVGGMYQSAGGVPGGKALKLVQTGGPLGGVLGADSVDLVLDFETFRNAGAILGSGGIIAADEDTCIVDLTRVLIAFCQYESCGKCFPCRMGMSHLLEVLERICRLEGVEEDLELMRKIGENMQAGSLCGHGQLGFNPVSSALQYFGGEFEEHILRHRCPTGRCQSARFSPKLTRREAR